jgi:hypothetical protein
MSQMQLGDDAEQQACRRAAWVRSPGKKYIIETIMTWRTPFRSTQTLGAPVSLFGRTAILEVYEGWLDPDDYEFIERVRTRGVIGGESIADLDPTIYGSFPMSMLNSAEHCKNADRRKSPYFNDELLGDLLDQRRRADLEWRKVNWKAKLKFIRQRRQTEKAKAEAKREYEERQEATREARRRSDREWDEAGEKLRHAETLRANMELVAETKRRMDEDKQQVLVACQRIYFQDGQKPTPERIADKLKITEDRVKIALNLLVIEGKLKMVDT